MAELTGLVAVVTGGGSGIGAAACRMFHAAGAAMLYLAGPAAGATTGTVLAVDGGMSGLRLPRG